MATIKKTLDAGLTSASMYVLTEDLTVAAVAAATTAIQTFTTATTGYLKVGDQLELLDDGAATDAYVIQPLPVTTVDQIRLKVINASAAAPGARAAANYKFLVIKGAAQSTSAPSGV